MLAALELGIIVGVALMVGLGFMAMVGMEILVDKIIDEYRFGMLNNTGSQLPPHNIRISNNFNIFINFQEVTEETKTFA